MLDLTQPAPEAYPQLTPGVTPRWRHRQESNLLHAVQEAASWTSTRNPKPHVERGPTWRRGAPTELRPLLEPPYLAGGLPSAHAVDVDYARAVYGVLTMLGTLIHQPDYKTDFPTYARYITTRTLLAATSWRASAVRGSDSSPGRALGADRDGGPSNPSSSISPVWSPARTSIPSGRAATIAFEPARP